MNDLIFTNSVGKSLATIVAGMNEPRLFVLTDANTSQFVLPRLVEQYPALSTAVNITVHAGDFNKTLDAARDVWKVLIDHEASRHDVLINVGGGVVTDLGGFVASTYRRGMHFINIPTTLLGAVDASVGGKNGVNFGGFKNQIGTFAVADATIISSCFFDTLTDRDMLSGYAEMLKHALLDSPKMLARLLAFNVLEAQSADLLALIEENVKVKRSIVDADFREAGPRKALNLGHTAAHAFESLAMARRSPIPHGYAVAAGCVVALVLSHLKFKFSSDTLHAFAAYVREHYEPVEFTCDDYPALLNYMAHDKKNDHHGIFNYTLLKAPGKPMVNVALTAEDITGALDIYRDLMGI